MQSLKVTPNKIYSISSTRFFSPFKTANIYFYNRTAAPGCGGWREIGSRLPRYPNLLACNPHLHVAPAGSTSMSLLPRGFSLVWLAQVLLLELSGMFFSPKYFWFAFGLICKCNTCGYRGPTLQWTLSSIPLFLKRMHMEKFFLQLKMKLLYLFCFEFLGLSWFTVQVNLKWEMWDSRYCTKYVGWLIGSTFLRKQLFL